MATRIEGVGGLKVDAEITKRPYIVEYISLPCMQWTVRMNDATRQVIALFRFEEHAILFTDFLCKELAKCESIPPPSEEVTYSEKSNS